MKRNIFICLLIFLIGAAAGMCLSHYHQKHFRDVTQEVKTDTVTVYDTMRYSRLQLQANTYELDLSKYKDIVPEFIFLDKKEVRDSLVNGVPHVVMRRQFYITDMQGAKIYHSGVASRIDSLSYAMPIRTVNTVTRIDTKHSLSMGFELNYSTSLNLPFQVEYGYNVNRWLSVYGYAEYELFRKQFGIGMGTKMQFAW